MINVENLQKVRETKKGQNVNKIRFPIKLESKKSKKKNREMKKFQINCKQ